MGLGHFGCRGRVCSGRRGAQLRPRRRAGARSLGVQKAEAGEGWGAGPRRASSLLRHRDAGDLGVWSSLGALPLRPSRRSAALRAWAGRRRRSGAGRPWLGAAAPGRPPTDGAPLLSSRLLSPLLTLGDQRVLTPSPAKPLTGSHPHSPDPSVPPSDSTPLEGLWGQKWARLPAGGSQQRGHLLYSRASFTSITVLSPDWRHTSPPLFPQNPLKDPQLTQTFRGSYVYPYGGGCPGSIFQRGVSKEVWFFPSPPTSKRTLLSPPHRH